LAGHTGDIHMNAHPSVNNDHQVSHSDMARHFYLFAGCIFDFNN